MEATQQSREEVLKDNPKLNPDPQPAARPARGAGSTHQISTPAGVADPWN